LNTQKKAVVLIIVILNCLEINIKVSDDSVSVKTTKFGKYREMLNINEVANSIELYFSKKMNENLPTHLPSQLTDCVR